MTSYQQVGDQDLVTVNILLLQESTHVRHLISYQMEWDELINASLHTFL
jgi:hypothetical protein